MSFPVCEICEGERLSGSAFEVKLGQGWDDGEANACNTNRLGCLVLMKVSGPGRAGIDCTQGTG